MLETSISRSIAPKARYSEQAALPESDKVAKMKFSLGRRGLRAIAPWIIQLPHMAPMKLQEPLPCRRRHHNSNTSG